MWEILGIKPTTDLKEIKSAYARLAKRYNPEEYPEEFKQIFDAYKAACEYAKGRRRSGFAEFSGTSRKEEVGSEYDFAGVDTEKRSPENEDTPKKEKFDFSGVNENYTEGDEEVRLGRLRVDLIHRINRIFDQRLETDIEKWNEFFNDTYFDELVFDREFRMQARKIFGTHLLSHLGAKLVSEKFGAGTQYFSRGFNRYTVVISTDRDVRSPDKKDSRKLEGKKFWLAAAAILIYMAVPILKIFVRTSDIPQPPVYSFETTSMPGYITLKPYNGDVTEFLNGAIEAIIDEKVFDTEILYERSMGKWLFEFGYAEFGEDRAAEINFYGDVFTGTVTASAAEKGAVLNMVFNSDDEAADGMEFTVYVISSDGERIVCTDRGGKEYEGIRK